MKINTIYKLFSLAFGVAAVMTTTYFLIRSPHRCIIPFEPNPYIRIPEIMIGLTIIPYYFKEIYNQVK